MTDLPSVMVAGIVYPAANDDRARGWLFLGDILVA